MRSLLATKSQSLTRNSRVLTPCLPEGTQIPSDEQLDLAEVLLGFNIPNPALAANYLPKNREW